MAYFSRKRQLLGAIIAASVSFGAQAQLAQNLILVQMVLFVVLMYLGAVVALRGKDEFNLVIPYMKFVPHDVQTPLALIDTSALIDGRLAGLCKSGFFGHALVIPKFVIAELQNIADSSDKLKRGKGRRGLDILNRLRSDARVDLQIFERDLPEFAGQPVDLKLVLLAKHLDGKVVTNDYNLNKVAKLHNVGVVNLNDIANSLKPVFLPGESIRVELIKAGDDVRQGVGYLEDGTMVVIEGGREHVGSTVCASVTNVLQNSAGRMIFGKFVSAEEAAPQTQAS